MLSEESKKTFENRSLKEILPEVEQRKKYIERRLCDCKLPDPVLVRIEPHPKTTLPHIYITIAMGRKTKIS